MTAVLRSAAVGIQDRTAPGRGSVLVAQLVVTLLFGCSRENASPERTPAKAPSPPDIHLSRDASESRPLSFLLITTDTLRADYLGTYGFPVLVSPNLDLLARGSLVFERAYATSPRTGPSHASILTSRHPSAHGVVFNGLDVNGAIGDGVTTLAEHLDGNGFATAAVVSSNALEARYGFDRGFEKFEVIRIHDREPEAGGASALVVAAAKTWLHQHKDNRFFLWAHFYEAHLPFNSAPRVYESLEMNPPPGVITIQEQRSANPKPVPEARAAYRAEVFELDSHLGTLFETLRSMGRFEDTIIAVVSDHGEYLSEQGQWGHQQLYDEMLHVPMMIFSARSVSGERRSQLASIIDLAPTVLQMLGVPPLPAAQGRDLAPAATANAPLPVFAEWRDENPSLNRRPAQAGDFLVSVQDGQTKLIRDVLFPDQSLLFDLSKDPDELRNLYSTDAALAKRLSDMLDAHVQKELPAGLVGYSEREVDPETLRMLKSLGYVQ